jgi:hypothetical protein
MHVFVIGMARSGTHSLCNIIREASASNGFVCHEDYPLLAEEAFFYMQGLAWDKQVLHDKIAKWKSHSQPLVCECNHRLGFFLDYINLEFGRQAKYIWLIRNPIDVMISDISTYAHWPAILYRYPDFFRERVEAFIVPNEKHPFNIFRLKPPTFDWDLWKIYLWEWLTTYKEVRLNLSKIPQDQRLVFFTHNITEQYLKILDFIGRDCFSVTKDVAKWAEIKADSVYDQARTQVIKFARSIVWPNRGEISSWIRKEFEKFPREDVDLLTADAFILKSLGIMVL